MKIALVEKIKTKINYSKYIDFDIDRFALTEIKTSKLLKADITLDFSVLEEYDYIILVGAEPAKFIGKITSVVKYAGHLVSGKYIPLFSPALLTFKPDIKSSFEAALELLHKNISGTGTTMATHYEAIDNKSSALKYLRKVINGKYTNIACDTETSALYPRDGYMLGISMSHKEGQGVYIDADIIDEEVETAFQKIFDKKNIVFHNAKFDMKFLEFHFKFTFKNWDDTLLMHYLLDENNEHGLKYLSMRYTDLGDYDKELEDFKKDYCKQHKILKRDFSYDLIPFDVLSKYAAIDTDATLRLYNKFKPIISSAKGTIGRVYKNILKPGTLFLKDIEQTGVPFSKKKLNSAQKLLDTEIYKLEQELYTHKEVALAEKKTGKIFNFGSTQQLCVLLYDILGLPILQKTPKGAPSANAEVLEELAKDNVIPGLILQLRQLKKIKATYIDKVLAGLDLDGRLRTGFHLHTTTSGRLSSSGKLNMQQLPRDNKIVKDCIAAEEGYLISSCDLQTGEIYFAAVLSKDKNLAKIFKDSDEDFHSSVARMVFRIKGIVPKELRQAAKAISFGILYGSGADKVAETCGCTTPEARTYIKQYFEMFPKLKIWLDRQKNAIRREGHCYSALGRKRRVAQVFSIDSSIASGGVRSAVNFLIQSVSSDVNLLAAIDMHNWLKTSEVTAEIFALVHDSILAHVKINNIDEYEKKLRYFLELDRGISILECPIGLDFERGTTYAFKKDI